jgi:hypothetical protein
MYCFDFTQIQFSQSVFEKSKNVGILKDKGVNLKLNIERIQKFYCKKKK